MLYNYIANLRFMVWKGTFLITRDDNKDIT